MSLVPRISSRSSTRFTETVLRVVRHTRPLAGVLVLCGLCACATAPLTRALHDSPPAGLPAHIELADTPFFAQQRYQCGPAALATVLVSTGISITPGQLVSEVYLPERQGSLTEELAAAARQRQRLVYPLAPSLTALFTELAAGHPVLVLQNLGLDWIPKWHFAVVVGYDLQRAEVMLRSGTLARRVTALSTFERTWQRSGYRALVILAPGEVPASAELLPYLQAAQELETSAPGNAALPAWQAATERWPDAPLAWMTLGNHAYSKADYPLAQRAFAEVTRLAPTSPDGWNNLAYSLAGNGCLQQARSAVLCAMALAPGDRNVQDTAREFLRSAPADDPLHCPSIRCRRP
jgi:hypothetical protein